MSIRHTIRIENLPNLKEATPITILIPANAGNSFMAEVDIPMNYLSQPKQLTASPILTTSSTQRTPPMGQAQTPSVFASGSAPSPFIDAVVNKSPSSPGRRRPPIPDPISQSVLPPGSAISRSSLSMSPQIVASPSAAQSPFTFSSSPYPSPSATPIMMPTTPPPSTLPQSIIPENPVMSKGASARSFSELLTSPKMLSPPRFSKTPQPSPMRQQSLTASSRTPYADTSVDDEELDTEMESGGMLPAMSVYSCSPAVDTGGMQCERLMQI